MSALLLNYTAPELRPKLLGYCPVDLRDDLWANDGFEHWNPDHICDDPDRSLIMLAAERAREHGLTRAEMIACDLAGNAEMLSMDLQMVEFINDPAELGAAMAALRDLRDEITLTLRKYSAVKRRVKA